MVVFQACRVPRVGFLNPVVRFAILLGVGNEALLDRRVESGVCRSDGRWIGGFGVTSLARDVPEAGRKPVDHEKIEANIRINYSYILS